MTNVHGISVAGGTFPAEIWHDYMTSRTARTATPSRPRPRPKFGAFYGEHSANGTKAGSGGSYYDGTTGGTTSGTPSTGTTPPSNTAATAPIPIRSEMRRRRWRNVLR